MLILYVLPFVCSAFCQGATGSEIFSPKDVQLVFKIDSIGPKLQYEGELKLEIVDQGKNQSMFLYERGLNITSPNKFVKFVSDPSPDKMRMDFETILTGANYPAVASFTSLPSSMNLGQKGFSVATSDSGRVFARTCFSPTFARTVFPTTNELSNQTTFVVTFELSQTLKVLFVNQPNTSSVSAGIKTVNFQRTNPTFPHNLGWVIFEEGALEKVQSPDELVHMWYRANQQKFNTTILLQRVLKYLEFMENLTGVSFGGANQTLKIVMLPINDLEPCTSWGLISLSEDSYGIDLEMAITRQWFGGRMSVESAADDWLIEGLVKYITYFVWKEPPVLIDTVSHYLMDEFYPALERDLGPFPIRCFNQLLQPRQVEERNSEAGSKGVVLLKTIEAMVGPETMIKTIKELGAQISSSSNPTISGAELINQMMSGLIKVSNFTSVIQQALDGGFILITKENASSYGNVSIHNSLGTKMRDIYHGEMAIQFLEWNPYAIFRYSFSESLWNDVVRQLMNSTEKEVGTKARYLDDAFTLARLNLLSYDVAMNVANLLKNDTGNLLAKRALKHFLYIKNVLVYNSTLQQSWKAHVESLVNLYQIKASKQSNLIGELCDLGFNFSQQLDTIPDLFRSNETTTGSLIKREMLCCNLQTWLYVWEDLFFHYNRSNDTTERQFWVRAMPCSPKKEHLFWLISQAQSGKLEISVHEILEIIMSSNRRALNFFNIISQQNNTAQLLRSLLPDYELLRFFGRWAEVIPTTDDLNKLVSLMETLQGVDTVITEENIAQLKNHTQWRLENDKKVAQRITTWLTNVMAKVEPNRASINSNVSWLILASLIFFIRW